MSDLDQRYPDYGFAQHKGYCTADHREALMGHGPCPSHRYSFINVRRVATASGTRVVAEFKPSPPDRHGDDGWGKIGASPR